MEEEKLPDYLTYNQFKALAERDPGLEGNWIYEVTQTLYDPGINNPYPKFELFGSPNKRLFLSFDESVQFIKNHTTEWDLPVYCSWLRQVPIGEPEHLQGVEWLFNKDGKVIDYTLTHSYGEGLESTFYGRPKTRQRFKKGDIVEVISPEEVKLAVLCGTPPDIELCWKRYESSLGVKTTNIEKKKIRAYGLDYTDEYVTVIDGPSYCYHEHVSPVRLMKPRFPIPSDLEAEMRTWKERAD